MKRVEELAKELMKKFNSSYFLNDWKNVARHVLIREIKARINELQEILTSKFNNEKFFDKVARRHAQIRIKQLTATLRELEGNNDQK